jgi:hypothetical protein
MIKVSRKDYIKFNLINEAEQVKIPVEEGGLGFSVADKSAEQIASTGKRQLSSNKKTYKELIAQLNALAVFNKDKHEDLAGKIRHAMEILKDSERPEEK